MLRKRKVTIGRVERVSFPAAGIKGLPVKIDTGAYRSSVWASDIKEEAGHLRFKLLGPKSEYYTGKELVTDEYKIVEVENSFGQKESRYSVFLSLQIGGKRVRTNFTLANREMKTYPALIGRKLLRNKFIVDVSIGDPLPDEEKDHTDNLD